MITSHDIPYSPGDKAKWQSDPRRVWDALEEVGAATTPRALFDAYDAAGAQSITGTPATVNIATVRTNTDTAILSFAGNQLTVTLAGGGLVDISYRSTIGNTGSDDFAFDVYLERAPVATGVFAEVPGTRIKSGKGT